MKFKEIHKHDELFQSVMNNDDLSFAAKGLFTAIYTFESSNEGVDWILKNSKESEKEVWMILLELFNKDLIRMRFTFEERQ